MNKADIRKLFSEKRKSYTAEEIQWKSLQVTTRFFARFSLENTRYLHVFLPIQKQNEPDTWPIIQRILKNYPALQMLVPKTDVTALTMESYVYEPGMTLQSNKWGMAEPVNGQLLEASRIDMILLPLLAFDERGYRVGYGKGFYDRYLPRCRKDILKIGLSLENPVPQITDIDQYDYKMDYCITPEKVWEFPMKMVSPP
jgi:5-formyltetrahydrofolate cyclo-ligase